MNTRGILVIFLLLAFLSAALMGDGSRVVNKTLYAEFATDTLGDTATIIYMIDFAALDSFVYGDSFYVGPNYQESVYIGWTSPLFMMTLTPDTATYGMDSMIYWDTIIFPGADRLGVLWTSPEYTYKVTPGADVESYTYICSVIYAADTYVVDWGEDGSPSVAEACDSAVIAINEATNLSDSVRAEDSTTYYVIRPIGPSHTWNRPTSVITDTAQTGAVSFATDAAYICSSLTAAINAESDLTDSITAQDSGTYVKLISNFGSDKFGGRWTHAYTDSTLDTAIHAQVCSTGMVADSMAATFNAEDTLAKYGTAANSGDSAWYVTSDDRGLDIKMGVTDTAQDTSRTQANVTSVSAITDTFTLAEFGPSLVYDDFRGSGVQGWIILNPCADTNQGFGESDSAKIWLFTVEKADSNLIWTVLDEDSCNSLPCTCRVDIIHAAANDTIFDLNLGLGYRVMDTLTDTVIDAQYRMSVDLIITDGF